MRKEGIRLSDKRFPFRAALNTSTLLPFQLDVKQQIDTAARAGYEGIELWVKDLEAYLQNGGTAAKLNRYIQDAGITAVNAIAFFKWADADPAVRKAGLEQAEREMNLLAEIGCLAVAAPPFGDVESVTLDEMAEHFATLSERGRRIGVEPVLEFWGRAKQLSRLSQAVYVAMESGVAGAKLLLDPFHMYTGGSQVEQLRSINGSAIGIVHVNDYPANPPVEVITDADRVFPGEGTAPSATFAKLLDEAGYRGFLSLELFQPDYGGKNAVETAAYGLEAMKKTYSV
jgi:sugar phosphate isomerase/epimerase